MSRPHRTDRPALPEPERRLSPLFVHLAFARLASPGRILQRALFSVHTYLLSDGQMRHASRFALWRQGCTA